MQRGQKLAVVLFIVALVAFSGSVGAQDEGAVERPAPEVAAIF